MPRSPNERWSPDVLSDLFGPSRRFRILTVIDNCTREWLALVADTSLSGQRVARARHCATLNKAPPYECGSQRAQVSVNPGPVASVRIIKIMKMRATER